MTSMKWLVANQREELNKRTVKIMLLEYKSSKVRKLLLFDIFDHDGDQ